MHLNPPVEFLLINIYIKSLNIQSTLCEMSPPLPSLWSFTGLSHCVYSSIHISDHIEFLLMPIVASFLLLPSLLHTILNAILPSFHP